MDPQEQINIPDGVSIIMVKFVAVNITGGYYFRNVLFSLNTTALNDNEYVVIDVANGDKYSRRMSFTNTSNKLVLEALSTGYLNLNTASNTYCVPYSIWKVY